uniref:Uncharacterized protein n=1 Tax=viral metagenome TaxID=1070528 RepID=A0A6C0IVX6_9ZZZZ
MPYCSVQEAWGGDFNDNSDKFNKIVPENSFDSEYETSDEYNNINVYNDDDSEVFEYSDKYKKSKKKKKRKNFSRTYNRLEEHTGPETRLPIDKKYNLQEEKVTENKSTKESYMNFILDENKKLKKMLNNLNNREEQDNIFDIALFIFGGIFIILIIDILTKNLKRFN